MLTADKHVDTAHILGAPGRETLPMPVILSIDVEEHFRIEAAAGLTIDPTLKEHYSNRLDFSTEWLLEQLDQFGIKATFFVVGQIAEDNPSLVRSLARAGHEIASHGWDHRRVQHFTPGSFRADVSRSKDALEQVTGQSVLGYRAPTFSIGHHSPWAIDVLVELGMSYDSSIYPIRHDRYGIPNAPRSPFLVRGHTHSILELPPVTLRLLGVNVPMGGGGYFRLFPLFLMEWAIRQMGRQTSPSVAMLYFHPWEFDPDQERLPLRLLSRFRTYVGLRRTRGRLTTLLGRHHFSRAMNVAKQLDSQRATLPCYELAGSEDPISPGRSSPALE